MTRLGQALGTATAPGDVICLFGELGAGKTVLAKGLGLGLGVRETVSSPSFILMAEYAGRLPLFHLDLYRLADAGDVLAAGLLDDRQSAGVTVIEWADRLADRLPHGRLDIRIDGAGDEPRVVELSPTDDRHRRLVADTLEGFAALDEAAAPRAGSSPGASDHA